MIIHTVRLAWRISKLSKSRLGDLVSVMMCLFLRVFCFRDVIVMFIFCMLSQLLCKGDVSVKSCSRDRDSVLSACSSIRKRCCVQCSCRVCVCCTRENALKRVTGADGRELSDVCWAC